MGHGDARSGGLPATVGQPAGKALRRSPTWRKVSSPAQSDVDNVGHIMIKDVRWLRPVHSLLSPHLQRRAFPRLLERIFAAIKPAIMPSKTDNPTYDTSVVVHKKNDDAVDMHILAERLDNLNTILGASAQGHFRRSLVAL